MRVCDVCQNADIKKYHLVREEGDVREWERVMFVDLCNDCLNLLYRREWDRLADRHDA